MPKLKLLLDEKNKSILSKLKWVNVSVDGWTDATMRCYNGYIARGIDDEWKMHTIPFAFEYVGGSHTGANIKKNFDETCNKFGKFFKFIFNTKNNKYKNSNFINNYRYRIENI